MNALARGVLLLGSLVVALLVFRNDWLTGDELYFVGLATLSGIALYAGYRIGLRQIDAEAREELIKARDEIVALRAKIEELQKKLGDAEAELQKFKTQLETRLEIQDDEVLKGLDTETSTAMQAVSDAGSAADAVRLDLDRLIGAISKPLETLPERQRLPGLWVTVGLSLAVLAFLIAKDVSIGTSSPSDTDSTPTMTTSTDTTPTDTTSTDTTSTETTPTDTTQTETTTP